MNKTFLYLLITAMFSMTYFSEKLEAQVITLQIPILEENPHQHKFFHELLETAIKEAGHTPNLIVQHLPQLRVKSYLGKGILSLYWMIESEQRDKEIKR